MKKLLIILSVVGFIVFAFSQVSPGTLQVNDNEVVVCADDTTKCINKTCDPKKCKDVCDPEKCKDACNHKKSKQHCNPNKCKDKSLMKKCSHESMNKKDPMKK